MKKGYEVDEIVEAVSGKVHRYYKFNGKPCKRIVLESKLCSQLAGYSLIEKDLRSVMVWLAEIDELREKSILGIAERNTRATDRKTYNIVKGLFVAALTFYGKSFSKCEGRPVKLERAQLEEKYRSEHDFYMRYRHNFAAHSGAEKLEFVDIALVFPKSEKQLVSPKLYRELFQPDLAVAKKGDVQLTELVEHARGVAVRKIERLAEKIMQEEILPKGREYWARK